jgi:mRNA interferase YafQ
VKRVAWHSSFERALRKAVRARPELGEKIIAVVGCLAADPFAENLRTHKLRGRLRGLWSAWVEYDCRVVFAFELDPDSNEDMIVLVDIGSHEEVY